MRQSLVFTFIANDKPGIVDQLSTTVANHGGNWLESRMTKLAGKFAGIAQISISDDKVSALQHALQALGNDDLSILMDQVTQDANTAPQQTLKLSILGLDRPGIVREVAQALANKGMNVSDMHSVIESAPMTGEPLFKADVELQADANADIDVLEDELDNLCSTLDLDWNLSSIA